MKPVMQTKPGADGNCFHACMASLFELSIDEVPDWPDGEDWIVGVRTWLRERNLGILALELGPDSDIGAFEGWFIVSGPTHGRGIEHATIWRDGQLAHDPHPSQPGLARPEWVFMLYPLDPARLGAPTC